MIAKAVGFLNNPKVVPSPFYNKVMFLKKQGLNPKEMIEAANRVGLAIPPEFTKMAQSLDDKGVAMDKREGRPPISTTSKRTSKEEVAELHATILQAAQKADRKWSLESLRQFDGQQGKQIYIALNGVVYDCTSAPVFYGPGKKYHVYAGREAGRALGKMTLMDFPEQHKKDLANPWVKDLKPEEEEVLLDWIRKFFKKYPVVGLVSEQ